MFQPTLYTWKKHNLKDFMPNLYGLKALLKDVSHNPFSHLKVPKNFSLRSPYPYDVFFRVENNFTDLCGGKIGRFHLKQSVYVGLFQRYRIWPDGLKHLVYRFFQATMENLLIWINNYIAKVKKKPYISHTIINFYFIFAQHTFNNSQFLTMYL